MNDAPQVIFIGSPTRDTLIRDGAARAATGGAAYISALASRWAGASTGIVARVPTDLTASVSKVFGPGGLARGGLRCAAGQLPGFRISYDDSDRATYDQMQVGMESGLSAADIPTEWLGDDLAWIHIAGIGADAEQQLQVVTDLRHRAPHWKGTISAGTCRAMIEAKPAATLRLLCESDAFFLNEEEWDLLCPSGPPPGHMGMVIVTLGPAGVRVIGGPCEGTYPALPVVVVDPTGAGDSFCGGFIGALVTGHEIPVQQGLQAAANVLSGWGADPLAHWVAAQVTVRADHDDDAIDTLAPLIAEHGRAAAFDFTGPPHLNEGHASALEMLVVSTLHQYGFWTGDAEQGWLGPMIEELDGVQYKGSDFIWAAFARAARSDPTLLSTERMASEPGLFAQICTADSGACPIPELATHTALHQAHGMAMRSRWPGGYTQILERANSNPAPVRTLLDILQTIPGYMSDPLAKKANLLAVILSARPEGFLRSTDPEHIAPIVDYHMMRVCLRAGLVTVTDPDLTRRLETRQWIDPMEELAIRQATGRAILGLVQRTERPVAAIDGLFFSLGRTCCLETEDPRCGACPLAPSCAQKTALFQPVFRTTAY